MRLVPPRVGEVEQRTRKDRDAQRFSQGLRGDKRRRLFMLLGNGLVLALLVGLPLLRGHMRALDAHQAYLNFARCIYGVPLHGGLGDLAGEAEYFAAQLTRGDRSWLKRCTQRLAPVAKPPALFVLPGVKAAEARVREALALLGGEFAGLSSFAPGMRMPDRSLRALRLLRGTVRMQLQQAGFSAGEAELPVRADRPPSMPAPARLPLYAAPDAVLSLWGDDHALHAVGVDATGVAYLEIDPGKPFSRSRLVRPRALRGYVRPDDQGWLLWATAPARCNARSEGCFGKSTRVAAAPAALLELPESRTLAAHLVGRPDRSMAISDDTLVLATLSAERRTAVQEFTLPRGFSVGTDLPALSAIRSWPARVDDALVLAAGGEALAFGLERDAAGVRLLQLTAERTAPLATLPAGASPWLVGCAEDGRAGAAFGNGAQLALAELTHTAAGWAPHMWPPLDLPLSAAVDLETPSKDRVQRVCLPDAALLVVRGADDALSAIVCRHSAPTCERVPVAAGVSYFSVLATARGALLAYAGSEAAQVRLRTLETATARLGPDQVPAACWARTGLCTRPTLARLGHRIVLVAPEKTDLLALESADEGQSWRAPPLL
jgi:hypothetical protein